MVCCEWNRNLVNNKLDTFNNIKSLITPEVFKSMEEMQQSRSDFQLRHFVLNQHDTDEMKFYQCVIEIQQLYYTIKTVFLEIKKMEVEIKNLKLQNTEISNIDAEIKEVALEQTTLVAVGAVREFKTLLNIYNEFNKKYTREDIENNQLTYWNQRLQRQSVLESIANSQYQASHLDSLRQIGAFNIDEAINYLNEQNNKSLTHK